MFGIDDALLIGGGLGLAGSLLGGMGASDAASSQQAASQALLQQQYGYGNSARFRAMGDFFGGQDLTNRILGGASDADINSYFGDGTAAYLRASPADREKLLHPTGSNTGGAATQQQAYSYRNPDTGQTEWRINGPNGIAQRVNGPGSYNGTAPAGSSTAFDPTKINEFLSANGGKGIIGDYQDLASQYGQRGKQALFDFDSGSQSLQAMADRSMRDTTSQYRKTANDIYGKAQGLEGLTRDWGADQSRFINEDAQRALGASNAQTQAKLAAAGLGNSTLVGNQMSRNATEMNRNVQRAQQDLANSRIDRQSAARTTALGLYNDNMGKLNDVTARFSGSNIDRAYSRAAQRLAMEQDNTNRDLQLAQIPLSLRGNLATSSIMNPGLNLNTASFIPQATGAGMTGSALGSTLAGIGGTTYGAWLQDYLKSTK